MKWKPNLSVLLGLIVTLHGCNQSVVKSPAPDAADLANSKKQIASMLDSFNIAAANSNYNAYFNFYTDDATFIGTDATEHWDKKAFMEWAKPAFDKKKTWNFKSIDRHIYFAKDGEIAWFDELLNTGMKICRGSGVVVKQGGLWKIEQYVLSMTIPNDLIDPVIKIKAHIEDSLINKISGN
jgi:ketosteroid isomerase-like protein